MWMIDEREIDIRNMEKDGLKADQEFKYVNPSYK